MRQGTVIWTPSGPMSVAQPLPFTKEKSKKKSYKKPSKDSGGMSYIDTKTGKGYEVSPSGVKKEIEVTATPSVKSQKYFAQQKVTPPKDYFKSPVSSTPPKDYFKLPVSSLPPSQRVDPIQYSKYERENIRIEDLEKKIIDMDAKKRTFQSRETKTGDNLLVEMTKIDRLINGKRFDIVIIKTKNPRTGEVTIRTYEDGRLTGGIRRIEKEKIDSRTSSVDLPLLNKLEKINLPKGVTFGRDNFGRITNIQDNNKGITVPLDNLGDYVSAKNLQKVGIISKKELKEYSKENRKIATSNIKKSLNETLKAFSASEHLRWKESQRQPLYDLYNLKEKDRNFYSLLYEIKTKKLSPQDQKNFNNILAKNIIEDINDKGSEKRLNAFVTIITLGGGIIPGATASAVYRTPKAVLNEMGIKNSKYESLSWKEVLKKTGVTFTKEAGTAFLLTKLFGLGGRVASKLPKTLQDIVKKIAPSNKALQKALMRVGKGSSVMLKKGFDLMAVKYLSDLIGETAKAGTQLAKKEIKSATITGAGVIGSATGIGLGRVKFKGKKTKAKEELIKKIETTKKYLQGARNSDYVKMKNAIKGGKVSKVVSAGKAKNLNKKIIDILNKKIKIKGVTRKVLLNGDVYIQVVPVKNSQVPKIESQLKVLNSILKGKKLPKPKYIPNTKIYKRHGIIVTTTQGGFSKAIAIEFNIVNGKPVNIGIKSGVGKGGYSLIRTYLKAKDIKGKGIRLKPQDIFVSKGKFVSSKPIDKNLLASLNKITTKQVIINGKKIPKSKLITLKEALMVDLKRGNNKAISSFMRNLYKNKYISDVYLRSNIINIRRTKSGLSINFKKGGKIRYKITPKGQSIDIGYSISKPAVPLRKPISVKLTKTQVLKNKKIKQISSEVNKINTQRINTKTNTIKITPKSKMKLSNKKLLENAMKNIITITKPITRTKIIRAKFPKFSYTKLLGSLNLLKTLVTPISKNKLDSLQKSLTSLKQLYDTSLTTSQLKVLNTQSEILLKNISALKLTTPISSIIPFIPPSQKIPKPQRHKEKGKGGFILPKTKTLRKLKRKEDMGKGYLSYAQQKKVTSTKTLPLTKERAFDILAYYLEHKPASRGLTLKALERTPKELLKRKLKSTPQGYFRKNRHKFILRRLKKGRETYEMIEKKKYRKNTPAERIKHLKKKTPTPKKKKTIKKRSKSKRKK